jgi:hypothetical protein
LLLSPLDFPEFVFGCAKPLGFISLITWEQLSLKCIQEDTDLSESLESEEGEAVAFPLSNAWWASVFNLLLAWEDCVGKWLGVAWIMGFKGGGVGKDNLG